MLGLASSWAWDGAERREKYITGELLAGVVYQRQDVGVTAGPADRTCTSATRASNGDEDFV